METYLHLIKQPIAIILGVALYIKYKLNVPEEFHFNYVSSKLKNMVVLVLSGKVVHDCQTLRRTIILQHTTTVKIMHQQRSDIVYSFPMYSR
jgi:hypothetical protein